LKTDPNLHSPIQRYLDRLHEELASLTDGEVASYIPELSHADPAWFGIALVTVDGHVYQAGESRQPFTVQSISKALVYGLALEDRGVDAVLQKVWVEPSGEAFNSISLEAGTGRPRNPMINAGAIATAGLIKREETADPIRRVLDSFARYTGHAMTIDEKVYRSEKETGHRNRAIAHLLLGYGILDREPEEVLDIYFKQCSIQVTARDLALMGACLANAGVNPITGVQALKGELVEKVLSVMSSCGMYDYSGAWIYDVGMPAKSGVGGGILAVLPGQFGLGVFSAPLDAKGNSVRGIEACKRISRDFRLHVFNAVHSTSHTAIRARYDGTRMRSRRQRPGPELELLRAHGRRIQVFELQGALRFGAAESIVQQILGESDDFDSVVVDLRQVVELDHATREIFGRLARAMAALGKSVLFAHTREHYRFRKHLLKEFPDAEKQSLLQFDDVDHALEWCEEALIRQRTVQPPPPRAVTGCAEQYLCRGMTPEDVAVLERQARRVSFAGGDVVFRTGEPAGSFFFILRGELDVYVVTDSRREVRLATLGPGSSFGELSMLNERRRTADVRAASEAECLEVDFDGLDEGVKTKLLLNMAGQLASRLERDARELKELG
jgi:glutaminase